MTEYEEVMANVPDDGDDDMDSDDYDTDEELKEAFRSGILPSSRTKTPTHLFLVLPLGPKNEV